MPKSTVRSITVDVAETPRDRQIAIENDTVISAYLAAYCAANGCDNCPTMRFDRGWFVLSQCLRVSRHRRGKVLELTERLRARAKVTP